MGNGFGGGGWMWLFGLLLIVGIVLLVVAGVRRGGIGASRPTTDGGPRPGRAREVLDERYARGELSTAEYQERLQSLRQGDQ